MGLEAIIPPTHPAPTPDRSIDLILGGIYFKETPPIDFDPSLPAFQYVAVGLSDTTQIDPAKFDTAIEALHPGELKEKELKYVVAQQFDRASREEKGDVLLIFPTKTLHVVMLERLYAVRFPILKNRSAGFITRTKTTEGVTYKVHGNSKSLSGVVHGSDTYRDTVLVPALKKARINVLH